MSLRGPRESSTGVAGRLAVALEPTVDSASAGPQSAAEVQVTQRLGRFVLLRQLGAGGMGSVFAAYDEQLDRKVALKILHKTQAGNSEQRLRTLREARAAARISHPNVIAIYDVGETNGNIYIAMEYVDGGTLLNWQQRGDRSWEDILEMYLRVGTALLAAHDADVIHRDIDPPHFPSG